MTSGNPRYAASAGPFRPGENMTVAIGFKKDTFAAHKTSLMETLVGWWIAMQIPASIGAFVALVLLVVRYNAISGRKKELEPIATEYIPPRNLSVLAASTILSNLRSVETAQLIDLAVRKYVRLHQTKEKSLFSQGEYMIEVLREYGDLRMEEKEFLSTVFGHAPAVGEQFDMSNLRNNTTYRTTIMSNMQRLKQYARDPYALYAKSPEAGKELSKGIVATGISGLVLASPALLVVALIHKIASVKIDQLTDEGLRQKRYLLGLEKYIKLAETDRIAAMQSPEGAEKIASGGLDGISRIVLYERVLPYAIVFGCEKEWAKALADLYAAENVQSDWMRSMNGQAFTAAAFADSMANFSSYSSSTTSSSSGGSDGGGSSGGGGGGGGGGGV